MKEIPFLILLCLIASCALSKTYPKKDRLMSALDGKDFTALIEGCGHQVTSGFTYCRKSEGSTANETLTFIGPITNCNRQSCVEFKVYGPDGNIIFGSAIPKNQTRKSIPWNTLLNRETFEVQDRGWWLYVYHVFWIDSEGNEHLSVSEGEIRLRIVKKEYVPLSNVDTDGFQTWKWKDKNGAIVKMTTGMRTYVSRVK